MSLEDDLRAVLEPLVREIVREEVDRLRVRWRWVTVSKAADELGISERALRMRISRGSVPVKRRGGRIFVDLEELDHQLQDGVP